MRIFNFFVHNDASMCSYRIRLDLPIWRFRNFILSAAGLPFNFTMRNNIIVYSAKIVKNFVVNAHQCIHYFEYTICTCTW